jgi:hypothetical protein
VPVDCRSDFAKFFSSRRYVTLSGAGDADGRRRVRVLLGLLETRATNSSNLESKSFRMGDLFDFL